MECNNLRYAHKIITILAIEQMSKTVRPKNGKYLDDRDIIHGDGKHETVYKEIEDLKGKVLWSNPTYTSEFSAQKVNIDLTDYNYIRVIYTHWGGSWSFLDSGKTPKGTMGILNPAATSNRRFTSNNTGVTFENPANNGNTLSQVPIYIIAYKYW